ncbi:unnamed protein product [Blepharisma stoltei]|uniref:Ycf1 n=1 Tax=Blepharisma stoltei TaxID=1481888 RepID=A0AAU9JNK7_9CILI|nr:unnamed protein product [Blepharisma stoltei]
MNKMKNQLFSAKERVKPISVFKDNSPNARSKSQLEESNELQSFWVDYVLSSSSQSLKRIPTRSYDPMHQKLKKRDNEESYHENLLPKDRKKKREKLKLIKTSNKMFEEYMMAHNLKFFFEFDEEQRAP